MAGPILNPKCEVIPLPFRSVYGADFSATPTTLPDLLGKSMPINDGWELMTGFGKDDMLPYFDCERLIQYGQKNPPWRAGKLDTWPRRTVAQSHWAWRGDAILIGPGWESYAADIYWAVARALRRHFQGPAFDSDKDQMIKMALEGMMRSHGRI